MLCYLPYAGASLQLYHEAPKTLIIVGHELKSLNTWKRVCDSHQRESLWKSVGDFPLLLVGTYCSPRKEKANVPLFFELNIFSLKYFLRKFALIFCFIPTHHYGCYRRTLN